MSDRGEEQLCECYCHKKYRKSFLLHNGNLSALLICHPFFLQNGWTPLFWAAKEGHKETVILLLDRGANMEAADKVKEVDGLMEIPYNLDFFVSIQNGNRSSLSSCLVLVSYFVHVCYKIPSTPYHVYHAIPHSTNDL